MNQYKTCSKCRQRKPITDFNIDRQKSDNLQSRCRSCNRKIQSAYYRANREKVKIKQQEYRENNRDKIRTLISDWTKRNPEKNRQTSLAFYHRNKHKKNNNELSWAKQNPEANREKTARREAQKRANQSFVILSKDLKKLYDSVCTYCGISGEIQADHVVPISRGGVHGISNLVPACRTCNQSKGSKLLSEWRLWKKENPR